MEASVNAFHPPRLLFSLAPSSSPPFHVGAAAISVLLAPTRFSTRPSSSVATQTRKTTLSRFRKGNRSDGKFERDDERKRERERSRRRRVYRGAQPVANSQRDYRRRITAIPRPNTNWSLGTAARSGSNGGERRRRFRACMERRCTGKRCTGATGRASERGNCRLLGPPGALRHHKAYATAIVPVLKPTPRTRPCDSSSLSSRVHPRLPADYVSSDRSTRSSAPQPPPSRPHLIIGIYGKNLATDSYYHPLSLSATWNLSMKRNERRGLSAAREFWGSKGGRNDSRNYFQRISR